jgi:hypothetical protein
LKLRSEGLNSNKSGSFIGFSTPSRSGTSIIGNTKGVSLEQIQKKLGNKKFLETNYPRGKL